MSKTSSRSSFPALFSCLVLKAQGSSCREGNGIYLAGSTVPPVNNYPSCCRSGQLIGSDERAASNVKLKQNGDGDITSTQAC